MAKNAFSKVYHDKSINYGMSSQRFNALVGIIDNNLNNKLILDVGCAKGYFGKALIKKGARVVGIDISKIVVKEAKKILTDAKIVDLNTDKLPFKNKEFDIVVASEIIEHLLSPVDVLKDLNRVLKVDGELIISTPNLLYWGNRVKFLKGEFAYTDDGVFDRGHIHFYVYKTLIEDLKKTGFKVIKENHVVASKGLIGKLISKFPGVFAYQFVVRCKKIK